MKFYEFKDEKRVDIFNERFYWHPVTKQPYRNVTTILGIIDKGYNYTEWLKNVGHNAEIITDRAGTFGTAFHLLVQRFLKGENVSYYDSTLDARASTELWERFNIWIEFWKELIQKKIDFKPSEIEYITFSEEWGYAGTVDFIATVDGERVIFDWKTGNIVGNKEELQLIAYMATLGIQRGYIVHIPAVKPNKKGYRIKEVNYTDEQFGLFLATKKVFDMENTDKPKVLTLPLEINIKEL